ncbi:MAG: serine/threonine-protein kinase, partial [Polyangiaceae bacterium]
WLARFDREAKAAAALRSPYVVQVLDYGTDRGQRFLVMELLDGEDLSRRLNKVGRLTPLEVLAIIAQVGKALALAAKLKILHRDLKPGNIFLAQGGDEEIVKVLDFGVAKTAGQYPVGKETATGTLVGSPHYMSPEQTRGTKDMDHRSDLWSLAVIMYQMLTGKRPFEGSVLGDVLFKIYNEEPEPPTSIVPELPDGVDAFFLRALHRDPDERYQSAPELVAAFAGVVREVERESNPSVITLPREETAVIPKDGLTRVMETSTSPSLVQKLEALPLIGRHIGRLLSGGVKQNRRLIWYTAFAVEIAIILLAVALGSGLDDEESADPVTAPASAE